MNIGMHHEQVEQAGVKGGGGGGMLAMDWPLQAAPFTRAIYPSVIPLGQ